MINILNKIDCVGCNACVQRCPKQCIAMHADEQGFLYPIVDHDLCIECGLCEKVCPVINQEESRKPLNVYAAKTTDPEVLMTSSSGGIFFELAQYIIKEMQGVVFGARLDKNMEVVHDYAETIERIKAFQGSKYVQSRIADNFNKAEAFLKAGRKVMFTGTPCQIAGLRRFLRKDYGTQLITVDVVCHGVPSPLVWQDYLQYITRPKRTSVGKNTVFVSLKERPVITGISFRDKRLGWEKFGFSVRVTATEESGENSGFQSGKHQKHEEHELLFEPLDKNLFMQGFLHDLYLRPSCYECPVKCGKSHSDITLADFWGIASHHPKVYNHNGVSLVLINTPNGANLLDAVTVEKWSMTYAEALSGNPSIERSATKPKAYTAFWRQFPSRGIECLPSILSKMRPSIIRRILGKAKRIVLKLFKEY